MPNPEFPFEIPIPTQGLLPHLPPMTYGFRGLKNARNWIYRNGRFFVRPGLTDFGDDIDERILGLIQYDHDDETDRMVMGTKTKLYTFDGGTDTWDDITGSTAPNGGNTAHWQFRTFDFEGERQLLAINSQVKPQIWDGVAATFADMGTGDGGSHDPPSAATGIVVSGARVVLCEGDTIFCSNTLDANNGWYPDNANGYFNQIAETPGDIICMLEFGNNQFAIYKESSVYMAYFQGDLTQKYRVELVRNGISGPVSPAAVFPVGELGVHAYLAESGSINLFDGSNVYPMGDNVQSFIRQTRSYDLRQRSFGFYDWLNNEVYVFYASLAASDIDTAVVVNVETRAAHAYNFPSHIITCGASVDIQDYLRIEDLTMLIDEITLTFGEMGSLGKSGIVFGTDGGQMYHHVGENDDGSAIPAFFETGLQAGPDQRRFNLLHNIEHFFRKTGPSQEVTISVGSSDYGEEASFQSPQTIDLITTGGRLETQHGLPGRLYSIKGSGDFTYRAEWLNSIAAITTLGLR